MKIILAEDSALLREGLVMVLSHLGHEVIAQASTADELLAAVEENPRVEVIITDVRMPPHHSNDGLEAAATIRQKHPGMPILVLSQYIAAAYAREFFSAGASGLGYLLKDRVGNVEEFSRAVTMVAGGGTVIDPDVVTHLMTTAASTPGSRLECLSRRELEILELMAGGLSNKEIEQKLFVSSATVAKHIGNIFDKLGLAADEGNRRVRAVLAFLQEH
ncbi:response regulator transcription factor [Rothia aerolata]|uniref:DNA-binding response regulator n=1 Tax=Rothia aerolata TaxID=1812262 RepID=A0A917IT59_9MICC|nr:response regulator transcription factor [Rothia aerolata]GGH62026.1 DNA-binding response regulator [Rothia aerolata]